MKTLGLVLLSGTLLLGACATAHVDGAEEQGETKVQFKDLPVAVQKTLASAAEGQTIATVDQEQDHGQMVYEADVKLRGTPYEIRVAPDGKLVSKQVDHEDQQGEHEDKDQDKSEKD